MASAENLDGSENGADLDWDGLGVPDEMLDKIFSFVSTKNLLRARRVCRKWREISELSIKRRLRLVKSGEWKVATLRIREQAKNDLLQRVRGNMRQPQNGIFVIKNPGKTIKCNTAPLVTAVLKFDYIATVKSLELENCIPISCWDTIGLIIVSKFKSITKLYMIFMDEEKQNAIPLCFEELVQQQRGSETASFDTIKFISITSKQLGQEFRPAGFNVVQRCPNLQGLNITCELGKDDHLVATGEFFPKSKHKFRVARSIIENSLCHFKPEKASKTAAFLNAAASCLHPRKVITEVTLYQCLSVIDWNNGAGLPILKNFPHLRTAKVELACVCENTEKIAFYSPPSRENKIILTTLERLFIEFNACTSSISQDSTGIGEPDVVSYEIVKSCPTLNTFVTDVHWRIKNCAPKPGRRTPRTVNRGYSLGAGRGSWDERGANSLGHGWTYTGTTFQLGSTEQPLQNAINPIIFESLLRIFRLNPPIHVLSYSPLDFLARSMGNLQDQIPSACKSLTLKHLSLVSTSPDKEVIDKISPLVFDNVKKLTWAGEESCPILRERFEFGDPAEYQQVLRKLMFNNLTTLSLWWKVPGNEAWQTMLRIVYSELPSMMPKVEIFVTPFMVFNATTEEGVSQTENHPYSLAQVLKLVRKFGKLRHLVLVAKNWYCNDNGLDPEQLAIGLEGLRSITVVIPSLSKREACSRLFVKLCMLAPTINKLNLFTITEASNGQGGIGGEGTENDGDTSQDGTSKTYGNDTEDQTPAIEYSGCTTIDDRLKVTSGLTHLLNGKAQFEGTKDSYMTWKEILTGPIDCLLSPDF